MREYRELVGSGEGESGRRGEREIHPEVFRNIALAFL
jgi:hypothetical protein